MCSCRWQRDRRDALTWQGTERSPCRQGATRAAQGPDPVLCLPSPQVRPHVTDFADPLPLPPLCSLCGVLLLVGVGGNFRPGGAGRLYRARSAMSPSLLCWLTVSTAAPRSLSSLLRVTVTSAVVMPF